MGSRESILMAQPAAFSTPASWTDTARDTGWLSPPGWAVSRPVWWPQVHPHKTPFPLPLNRKQFIYSLKPRLWMLSGANLWHRGNTLWAPRECVWIQHRASVAFSKWVPLLSHTVWHHSGQEHGLWNQRVLGSSLCSSSYMVGDLP